MIKTSTFILFSLIILINLKVYSQGNEYFDHNPVWLINSVCGVPAPCIANENYNYYLNGDTVVNSYTYKKIFRKGTGSISWLNPPPVAPGCISGNYSYATPTPQYFIRSSGKQMYLIPLPDTSEVLLYDFNLEAGDTLPLTYNNFETDIFVTSIDSFYTPYGYRKKFLLSPNSVWTTFLLEGIGHERGFVEFVSTPFDCGYTLDCFSLNDTAYFPVQGPTCELTLNIPLAIADAELLLAPNPFSEESILQLGSIVSNVNLILYDVRGKIVRQIYKEQVDQIIISREQLSSGVYFYKLTSPTIPLRNGKMIIID